MHSEGHRPSERGTTKKPSTFTWVEGRSKEETSRIERRKSADGGADIPVHPEALVEPDPMSTPYNDLFSQRPTAFQKHKQSTQISREASPSANSVDSPISRSESKTEAPIAAFTPASQKASPGPVQNAFDRMRPKRTPLQL